MPSVVLITGASTGIGRLTAERAARAGHTVFAAMRQIGTRNAAAANDLQRIAGNEHLALTPVEMDVCDAGSVQRAVEHVLAAAGRIDAVVNNAGLMSIGLAEGYTEEQAHHQMDVNFMGPFRVCRAVLPQMRAQGSGLLVHVTSIVGRVLFPGCALYCASKFAYEAFAEVLQYELTGTGVESVIVEPGPYPTQLLVNSPAPADAQRLAGYGELAGLRENFLAHFAPIFSQENAHRTQEVADAILRLIESAPGSRAMRTVCGDDFGAHGLNKQIAPLQAETLRALNMSHMVPEIVSDHIGRPSE